MAPLPLFLILGPRKYIQMLLRTVKDLVPLRQRKRLIVLAAAAALFFVQLPKTMDYSLSPLLVLGGVLLGTFALYLFAQCLLFPQATTSPRRKSTELLLNLE